MHYHHEHLILGENLAMQRENEKQAIPVQQKQANSDVKLEPFSFIIQCLVFFVSSFFGSIQLLWPIRLVPISR